MPKPPKPPKSKIPKTKTPKIGVIGDLLEDVVVRPTGPIRQATDTQALITQRLGGCAATISKMLAVQNVPVRFIGNAGKDSTGESLLKELSEAGAETGVSRSGTTGTVIALLDEKGERNMLTDRGSSPDLSAWEDSWLEDVSILYIPAYSLIVEPMGSTCMEMILSFRSGNCFDSDNAKLVICLSSTGALTDFGKDRFLKMLLEIKPDILVCNRDEADFVSEGSSSDISSFAETIVITNGPEPTQIISPDAVIQPPVMEAVKDTTGAGDIFSAGFLAGLYADSGIEESVGLGHRLSGDILKSRN